MVRLTFRSRLALVMLLVSVLPVVVTAWVALSLAERHVRHASERRNEAVLEAVRSNLELYVSNRAHILEVVASHPAVQGLDVLRAPAALGELIAGSTFFIQCRLYDLAGRPIAAAPRTGEDLDAARAARDAIQTRSRRFISGGTSAVRLRIVAVPVYSFVDPSRPVGALAGTALLDSSGVHDILQSYKLRDADYVAIVDRAGDVIARGGPGLVPEARRFVLPGDLPADGRTSTVTAQNGRRGDLVSLAFSSVLGAWIAVGQPLGQALALLPAMQEEFAFITLLAVLIALTASVLVATSLSAPALELARGIDRLREGVLSHRVTLERDDELGKAGEAFNALAEMLQKRTLIASIWEKLRRGQP